MTLTLPQGKIEVDMPLGEIDQDGIIEIRRFLAKHLEATEPGIVCYLTRLFPEQESVDWQWRWQVGKGTSVGNLPKRISSRLFKNHRYKLPEEAMTEIGNIAKKHTQKTKHYVVDFTNELYWQPGEFGDDLSCFMGRKHTATEVIADVGGYAARFWTTDKRNGIGRVWLLPYPVPTDIDKHVPQTGWVALNGYYNASRYASDSPSGQHYGQLQTIDLAKVVAHICGLTYKPALFTMTTNLIYANSGGKSTFLLANPESIDQFEADSYIQYNPDCRLIAPHWLRCAECGDHRTEFRPKFLNVGQLGWLYEDGEYHCRECVMLRGIACCNCGHPINVRRDRFYEGRNPANYQETVRVCRVCYYVNKLVKQCVSCGRMWPATEKFDDRYGYCRECHLPEEELVPPNFRQDNQAAEIRVNLEGQVDRIMRDLRDVERAPRFQVDVPLDFVRREDDPNAE